jgi:serine/threonine protein kinase
LCRTRPFSNSQLPQGSFGAAFRASYTAASESGAIDRTCVIKRVDINRKSFKLVMRESWFLRQLQHPNIARLLHQYVSPNSVPSKADPRDPTVYFIQDDGGQTLQTYIRNRYIDSTAVPVEAIAAILRDLLSALVYLQRLGVLHRDIKADNVLVCVSERNCAAKLIDFGLAKKFDSGHSNVPARLVHERPCAMHGEGAEADECEAHAARPSPSAASAAASASAGTIADDETKPACPSNFQSRLFRVPRQYAPEALGLQHLGLLRQFTHDSDLWAVGIATRHELETQTLTT